MLVSREEEGATGTRYSVAAGSERPAEWKQPGTGHMTLPMQYPGRMTPERQCRLVVDGQRSGEEGAEIAEWGVGFILSEENLLKPGRGGNCTTT